MKMFFFRALLPSWKFFEQDGAIATLFFRLDPFDEWQNLQQKKSFSWIHFFSNPDVNWMHSCDSLLENFSHDVTDPINLELIEFWLLNELRHRQFLKNAKHLEFKIAMTHPLTKEITEDLFCGQISLEGTL